MKLNLVGKISIHKIYPLTNHHMACVFYIFKNLVWCTLAGFTISNSNAKGSYLMQIMKEWHHLLVNPSHVRS